MREVIIYGIRDKATCEIRYVGQSTHLRRRRSAGYHGRVAEWLATVDWEYVELARTDLDGAVREEQAQIERLRAEGADLLNHNMPGRSSAGQAQPKLSGRTRTHAERRAAGLRRLEVSMDGSRVEKLEALCAANSRTKADQVRAMINRKWEEIQKR